MAPLRPTLTALALVLALSLGLLGYGAWRLTVALGRLQQMGQAAAADPGALRWPEVRAAVRDLRGAASLTRIALTPWRGVLDLGVAGGIVPAEYGQVAPLLDVAVPLTEAAVHAVDAGEQVAGVLEAPAPGRAGGAGGAGSVEPMAARVGRALDAAQPSLEAMRGPLARAARARPALRPERLQGRLQPAARVIALYDEAIQRYPNALDLALDAPAAWRWLAGIDAPRTFHVLGQNRDELRATGGFLATAGEVTVDQGVVRVVYQGNPGELDDPYLPSTEPPRPLREFMGLGSWHLQDANWWADFPTSAAQAERFWSPPGASGATGAAGAPRPVASIPVDGTLAADDGALARLVGALGPIRLPGEPDPVTPETLPDLIAQNVYAGATTHAEGTAIQDRKSRFLAQLFSALMEAALNPPPDRRAALGVAVLEAFRNKELLLTLDDPRWAAALRELGWDGHLSQAPGDFLYLVETTVSYTKLARRMQTELAYTVELDDRAAIRRARIGLSVRNGFSAREVPSMYPSFYFGIWWNPATRLEETHLGRYAGYYRFYLPKGTLLAGSAGWDAPLDYVADENGRTVVGGYAVIDPGQAREMSLEVIPPPEAGAPDGAYRVLFPRQPSALARPVRARLVAPAGFRLADTSGTGAASGAGADGRSWLEWRAAGAADVALSARVRPYGA